MRPVAERPAPDVGASFVVVNLILSTDSCFELLPRTGAYLLATLMESIDAFALAANSADRGALLAASAACF